MSRPISSWASEGEVRDGSVCRPEAHAFSELEARVRDRTRLLIESEGQLRLKVAEEQHMRKQQEIVVDLTSHELRNPLNATWQNTEMVEDALERLRPLVPPEGLVALDEAQDAIESVRHYRCNISLRLSSILADCVERRSPDPDCGRRTSCRLRLGHMLTRILRFSTFPKSACNCSPYTLRRFLYVPNFL